jgi:8-oxo-dGTP pyrophosphatase MutT (NUDIX family)
MEDKPKNSHNLRTIQRKIASAVIISKDNKFLLGRKDPSKGGVYKDSWHLPGGGIESGETIDQAVIREINQEVAGLDASRYPRKIIPIVDQGSSEKTLATGEVVLCKMEFNRVEIRLDQSASQLKNELQPGDDLVELQWFNADKLTKIRLIPGGLEFFREAGYID